MEIRRLDGSQHFEDSRHLRAAIWFRHLLSQLLYCLELLATAPSGFRFSVRRTREGG